MQASFEKHLHAGIGSALAPLYMICSPVQEERKKLLEEVTAFLHKKCPDSSNSWHRAGSKDLAGIVEMLETRPLFHSHIVVVVDFLEEFSKKQMELFEKVVSSPASFVYVVLGASSFKPLSDLYNKVKQDAVVLDLSDEKPWDKQKRLQQWLNLRAQKEGKKLTASAVELLFDLCGMSVMSLEQELLKGICFSGEKEVLSREDLLPIASSHLSPTGWALSEALIWEENPKIEQIEDLSLFLAFVGQVRYHMQVGKQIAYYARQNKTGGEMVQLIPSLRASYVDKYRKVAAQRGVSFFDEASKVPFHIEMLSKNSSLNPEVIFTTLITKIQYLKKHHVIPTRPTYSFT